MPHRSKRSALSTAAALTLGAGLAATALLCAAVGALEVETFELGFQQRADLRVAALRRGLDDAVEVLTITNDLFKTFGQPSREQFRDFTLPLLRRHPFIQAFNYQRALSEAERPAYEAALAARLPGQRMRERAEGDRGALVPVRPRPLHIVVDYLEPYQGNEAALGLDLAPNGPLRGAIEQAVASGQVTASPLLRLAQERGGQQGFVLLMPLFRAGAPSATAQQRRAAWIGNTGAVIRSTDLVHKILLGAGLLDDAGLRLRVYTGDAPRPDNLVYGPPAEAAPASTALLARAAPAAPADGGAAPPGPAAETRRRPWPDGASVLTRSFNAAGKAWHVQVTALPRPLPAGHLGSLATLLGGLLLSALAAALVQSLTQRRRGVERQVEARTHDLQLSNEKLSQDVAARKATELALQHSEHRFRRLLALSSDWYWEQDAAFRFTHITDGFFDKGHLPRERFLGLTRWDNNAEMRAAGWGREHIARLEAHLPFNDLEYSLVGLDGVARWFSTSGEPVFDAAGAFQGYRGTGSEITARKLTEQRIQHIAHHDVLTGLPNRVLLHDRLGQAVAYANRSGHPLWVMLIDLDRFKFVNDSLGHKAGDLLLKTVAGRLQDSVRESDTVARLSGDEFVALLTEHPDEALTPQVTERIMRAVAQPVLLEGKEFFVTCSIGVAVHQADGAPAQHLIEHADIAMYCAKKLGRNNTQFYQPSMNEAALERLRIEGALRKALERDELVLYYQPQLDLDSGRIVGMEALLRWRHPELGMVQPDRFIGLAEETGLIVPIGAWVLASACAQTQAWLAAGLGPLRVAVNLSARQFGVPGLPAAIAAVLAASGLAPACLELELTESLLMSDVALAVELLQQLKALGLTLSIDDFGTGYSSLSYLRSFPIDVLKIDRSFVSDIGADGDEAAIVVSIIALAHNLKLRVVAEGVESARQLDYLWRNGCDQMQGFHFSPPVPAAEFEQMLRDGKHLAPSTAFA
ncbi:bifunctional diguanylate cyclase/phosphodiesterase [Rugamonas rubra]|uniref:Diguanylate cyclase (GGDEF) domain-containing protein n=1 Tax=Rugamonas rubra TaxID=758825 RepID=A0A1I4TZ60_9BURK|nr:EAL domain-containing protein [Rugamonas rubra]SFM81803.1 diguanylate cyclase (GGDEF) domain-containing protein [Rugamonas rubra]